MSPSPAAAIWRLLLVTLVTLPVAGLGLMPRPAEANTVVAQSFGNLVQHADYTIGQLEQMIDDVSEALGDDLGDPRLQQRLDRAQTPGEKAQAIEDRIEDKTGGLDIPWDNMSAQLRSLHRLAAFYRALQAWRNMRDGWAAHYEALMGRPYEVSQVPGRGVLTCDEEEFAYNTVEVSTTFGKAVMPVEREFAANRPLRPGDVQVAVLTDFQQNPAGDAKSGPRTTLKLAHMQGEGSHVAGGFPVQIRLGLPDGMTSLSETENDESGTATSDDRDARSLGFFIDVEDPSSSGRSAHSQNEGQGVQADNPWPVGWMDLETYSVGLDKKEPLTDVEIEGAYFDCFKLFGFVPYGDERHSPESDFGLGLFADAPLPISTFFDPLLWSYHHEADIRPSAALMLDYYEDVEDDDSDDPQDRVRQAIEMLTGPTRFNTDSLPSESPEDLSLFGTFVEPSIYDSGPFGGSVVKLTPRCHETATRNWDDLIRDPNTYFVGAKLRFGDSYQGLDIRAFRDRMIGQLGENGIAASPDAFSFNVFRGTGDSSYTNIDVAGEGYRIEDGGCRADYSDLWLFGGELQINQPREINPATDRQLSAGGVQVAALPEPEARVQVAAKAEQALPNDFYFHSKGHIREGQDDQWALKAVGFKPVGRDGKGSLWPKRATPVLVAVVDTGLDPTHPDIAGAIYANPKETPGNGVDDDGNGYVDDVFGWNFVDDSNNTWDNNGHGTFIAGIIAARSDDRVGIAGVNPWARILPVKVAEFNGQSESVGLMEGIYYAAKMGARVINVSIGGRKLTKSERFAIDYANDMGALVVVAAGNDGIDVSDYSPAGIPGAITVAATGRDNKRAKFSNFGAAVDIAAPGVEVLSLRARQTDLMLLADKTYEPGANIVGRDGLYYHLSGTSFSAPFVAGVASLLFSIDQDLTPDQVKRMILQSARDIDEPGFDWLSGYGMLDAAAAVKADPAYFVDARLTDVGLVERGGQNFLQPLGTASANRFKRAWIEIGQGVDPKKWVKASAEMKKGVTEGALALVDVQHFKSGGDWTLKLVVEHHSGKRREARYKLALE